MSLVSFLIKNLAVVILLILSINCNKKSGIPENKFAELKKPDTTKISGIYFLNVTGTTNYYDTGASRFYSSELKKEVTFLGNNINEGMAVFACMKIDLPANQVKIFLPLQKESLTYPITSEYEINYHRPNEANYILTMKTPLSEVKFTVDPRNGISFPLGRIWRKEKYNGKELKSEEDCGEFSLKILDSCKVQRRNGEYFISEPEGWDIRKDLSVDGEILTHLPLNAKVYTDEFDKKWNESEVSWKKVRYEGGEGYIDSIHLEKTPSHCYEKSIPAKRILLANAEWGGVYFDGGGAIYARENDDGGLGFEVSHSSNWEIYETIDKFEFLNDTLLFQLHSVETFEGELINDYLYSIEIPFSRFHMITPWNRMVEFEYNSKTIKVKKSRFK